MSNTQTVDNPPPFEPHTIELDSVQDGTITGVSVYAGRAEVTRVFRFALKDGQNQVHVSGLPNAMDIDSLRVEGRGAGVIQEVSVSVLPHISKPEVTPRLKELQKERKILEQASYRYQSAVEGLHMYIASVRSDSTKSIDLTQLLADYHANAEQAHKQKLEADEQLEKIDEAIEEERKALDKKKRNPKLSMKASVGIFTESAGDVEIALIYAVSNASWQARYDIRVDTQTKQKTVVLVYKGSLTQSTGEDWTDVPLVLETATPTFDKSVPELSPWTICVERPHPIRVYSQPSPPGGAQLESFAMARPMMAMSAAAPPLPPAPLPRMAIRAVEVNTKGTGNVSATFTVPGKMTVPSDDASHSVTITELSLEATMSWVSVPKKDTKVHLNAKIKNSSEFLLLEGPASVYVDGSFISRSNVPAVSPDETFDCPLGLDPAIKVTYHPQTKKISKTGLINKSDVYTYTQRITIHNTKSIDVENIKIVDQVHVSEDSIITVKLISPALHLPGSGSSDGGSVKSGKTGGSGFNLIGSSKKDSSTSSSTANANASTASAPSLRIPAPIKVAQGVTANWDFGGEEEENLDVASLGKDGKLNFFCALAPQAKTNLTLQWEVSAPAKTKIEGL